MQTTSASRVLAHSLEAAPLEQWEPLDAHLAEVAALAARNAGPLGFEGLARAAGQLHDIGKASAQFQAYIRGAAPRGGDHSTAGAREAVRLYSGGLGRWLALVIAGHHSGLADADELDRRLDADLPDYTGWEAHTAALPDSAAIRPTQSPSGPVRTSQDFVLAFAIRMLFSCLVDADCIATETFKAGGQKSRGGGPGVATLRDRLGDYMRDLQLRADRHDLNTLRTEIFDHAVAKAENAPGFFTLTVPTGGGKTLVSLAFALAHAAAHGKRRVVVVIPFTAIIEQTADQYRRALGDDAVLEHHSGFDPDLHGDNDRDGGRLRRAADNWDAPVVVTTAVQFFESLFASRTTRCRKLHNLADSVVILDEAQTTPPGLLLPCLAALEELRRGYGASVVLCTATQPAWRLVDEALVETMPTGRQRQFGLDIPASRELAPRPDLLAIELKRTRIEVMPDPVDDDALAAAFARAPRMLCIVNSRAHARAVYERIRHLEGAVHLTTLMCAAHRRLALDSLRTELKSNDRPVRLVATSLIEAGVDISFPEVWRASAGLDSIAQAAGRCNREGELLPTLGRVVVFDPVGWPVPRSLLAFQQAARPILRDASEPLAPSAIADFFKLLYAQRGMASLDSTMVGDTRGVLSAIAASEMFRYPFESIATGFRMIDETMLPVLVPWREGASLIDRFTDPGADIRRLMRQLQRFTVGIPEQVWRDWRSKEWLQPAHPKLGDTVMRLSERSLYDNRTGLDLSDGAYRAAEQNLW